MRKRRVIGQAFSESAIRSLEGHVIEHVTTFIAELLSDSEGTLRKSPWSSGKNMANMCKIFFVNDSRKSQFRVSAV